MSSTYCVQLKKDLLVIAMATTNPVNFTSLQFSLSVNSLVIFLFSKYPFNYGNSNVSCINYDEFGFAQVGTTFNIDLSNYQGYYMLILIFPQGINLYNYGTCYPVLGFTMTFQNTTISPIQNMSIQSNFGEQGIIKIGEQGPIGFCTCYDGQTITPNVYCANYSLYSIISLNDLNNYLVIGNCQAFLIQNNTTVGFVTPYGCPYFGTLLEANIVFNANQNVIDFLNSNNISYSILSSTTCQLTSKLKPCFLPYFLPCKPFYQITKLLTPPKKYSLISSKLWNEIVLDLYLAYTVYKYINYLSKFPYPQNIYNAIFDFYNFYENFQPYVFTSLIHARKGLPLTADYFNSLIDAIIELANFANIQLQKGLSHVQPDQIVQSLQFDNIVYNVNQLLTFNYNQYFLLSCTGNKFNNLLNSISTFLNVLINNLTINITIPSNVYIKNLLIYNNQNNIFTYGTIANLIINKNYGEIQLLNNAYINLINIETDYGGVYLNDNTSVNSINVKSENYGIFLYNYSTLNILNIETDNGGVYLNGYNSVNTINIGTENAGVYLYENSYINTLYIENNNANIYLFNNAIIENLICKQNSGKIYIYDNAQIINNQCGS
jgi:hypothetical protein